MKNITMQIALVLGFILFLSCSNTPKQDKPKPETPKALEDGEHMLDIKSYSRSGNLVEELYEELVGKTPALKKIEDELDALKTSSGKAVENFSGYNSKSANYYYAANNQASLIADSLLRKKMIAFIESSNKAYGNQTAQLNSLLTQISNNSVSINDHHNALKICVTLPLIQDYQKNNQPDKKQFIDIIKQQQQVTDKINNATPKL